MNKFLASAALPLAMIAALPMPVFAAVDIAATAANPVIELSVTETVNSAPDMATIGTGVQTRAKTAQEAMRLNATEMDKVIKRLVVLGIERKAIQTSGINLSAEYDYSDEARQNGQPRLIGYQVTNQVQVKVRKLDRLGSLLDAVVASGANNINGPSFSIDDDSTAKKDARDKAMKRSETQALDYARRAGFSGVQLVSVSESIQGMSPMDNYADKRVSAASIRAESAPVEPGQIGTSVTVNTVYKMTR